MHGDFKYNFIRFHILNEASKNAVQLDDFKNFFDKKDVSDVTDDEVKDQLEHLRGENFLMKKGDSQYEITDQGLEEIDKVKKAMSHF
ncbi:hypothetical protein SAMN02745249_02009 [Atopostipes suicloacalis DSM 15692]|uniref:Uncharacterized protein n=1 Tax=Atopostipes suicloacalis DSM 15692 TaxID=1121025 RepID=A0A1M4ZN85_9LACT|nr:hypothetical protein [Atopostipes suicloacalis]SHF19464.1 hypothetical protein SAMN02745249_02009 [Atopostipes suicloacalis DSM 15692]